MTVCEKDSKPILSTIAGGDVIAVFKRFVNQEIGENIWQRGFYEQRNGIQKRVGIHPIQRFKRMCEKASIDKNHLFRNLL